MFFLYKLLGVSFMAGLGVLFIGGGINVCISKCINTRNKKKQKLKDKRLNTTTEAISNIKTLKFY